MLRLDRVDGVVDGSLGHPQVDRAAGGAPPAGPGIVPTGGTSSVLIAMPFHLSTSDGSVAAGGTASATAAASRDGGSGERNHRDSEIASSSPLPRLLCASSFRRAAASVHSSFVVSFEEAVATLSARDAEAILRFVAVAGELGGDEPFTPLVLEELGRLVRADTVVYCEQDRVRKRVRRSGGAAR